MTSRVLAVLACLTACAAPSPTTQAPRPGAPSPAPSQSRGLAAPLLLSIEPSRLASTVSTLAAFGTRHTLSETASPTRGVGAAAAWIKAQLDAVAADPAAQRPVDLAMQVSFDRHTQKPDGKRVPRDVEIVNVMAVLPGAMPAARARRYYIVGHYDSRTTDVMDGTSDAPGANDNASGTAVLIELARVMARARFDATLVFLATAGEEQGLLGAKLHAEEARAKGWDVRAVLNDDIVGDPSPVAGAKPGSLEVRVFSEGIPADADAGAVLAIRKIGAESDSPSRELARFIADVAEEEQTTVRPLLVFRPDRFLRGGDHLAFAEVGFAGVRFTTPVEHYDRQHTPGDLPSFVDATYLAGVAALDGVVLAHLANAPSVPPDVRIVTSELMNDTELRWSPSPEPDVAGYEVAWRATTASRWEHAKDFGAATDARIPISKDDVVFGVRAYDKDGWRSPVGFARAAAQ